MLSAEEFSEIHSETTALFCEYVLKAKEDGDRSKVFTLMAAHLGLNERILLGFIDYAIEKAFQAPSEVVYALQPETPRSIFMALVTGIEVGKRLEKLSHVCTAQEDS